MPVPTWEASLARAAARLTTTSWKKSVGGQDIPEVLVLSYVYALPAGKGHYVGGNSKLADAILGHWQFSGIQSYTQGTPADPSAR